MKRLVLKKWLENSLIGVVMLSIMFVTMTIETLGNATYNKALALVLLVNVIIVKVLVKFGRNFNNLH